MSPFAYHALWLTLALAGIAAASAVITWRLRTRELRSTRAEEVLQALARYSECVAAQRRAPVFSSGAHGPLHEAEVLARASFPELSAGLEDLLALHERLVDFMERQQRLRMQDPELWLESDHDGRFMDLWREHRLVVHRLAESLRLAARPAVDPEPESIFPA